jgi:hypothetical protein
MFKNKDTGGKTEQLTKQGKYLFEVQSDKPLTAAQIVRLAILISDAVRLTTGKGSYCVPVYR